MTAFFLIIIIAIALTDQCRTKKEIQLHAPEAQRNIKRRQEAWDKLNNALGIQK